MDKGIAGIGKHGQALRRSKPRQAKGQFGTVYAA
jgi:hypothetical protein